MLPFFKNSDSGMCNFVDYNEQNEKFSNFVHYNERFCQNTSWKSLNNLFFIFGIRHCKNDRQHTDSTSDGHDDACHRTFRYGFT